MTETERWRDRERRREGKEGEEGRERGGRKDRVVALTSGKPA